MYSSQIYHWNTRYSPTSILDHFTKLFISFNCRIIHIYVKNYSKYKMVSRH